MKSTAFILFNAFIVICESSTKNVEVKVVTNGEFSPDPCFPLCTTGAAQTSPPPERGCFRTDCFDEPLCAEMCEVINQCHSYEWILNNDDNDIFGETWCAVSGYGMCYCCDCD